LRRVRLTSLMRLRFLVILGGALSALGCAEQLQLLDRGPVGGVSPCSFWPPPPSSITWLTEPSQTRQPESLSAVAREVEFSLREGGYTQQRWYPIGTGQSHGFAVTTRLEELEDGRQTPARERWSPLYADAANLRWLAQARTPALPHPGRYRSLLLAYTDLPIGGASNAPIWNEETIMDWPDAPRASSPSEAIVSTRVPDGYRLTIFEYEYGWNDADNRGRWVPPRREAPNRGSPPLASALEERGFALRRARAE